MFKVSNIAKSLMRYTVDMIEEIKTAGISPDMEYYSWDSRGEVSELDTVDLIGLAGWTFEENRGLWRVNTGITISTINDENLFRELELIDVVHDHFGEDCVVPMRDENGDEYTQLVVSRFEVMPAGQSEKRNYRGIGVELKRTENA